MIKRLNAVSILSIFLVYKDLGFCLSSEAVFYECFLLLAEYGSAITEDPLNREGV